MFERSLFRLKLGVVAGWVFSAEKSEATPTFEIRPISEFQRHHQ